jgi:hypothetical protein
MEFILNTAQVAATLIAAVGLVLSALEIRRTRKEKRLEQVQRLVERLQSPELRDIYHEVERDEFHFPFDQSHKEKEIDALLGEFNLVANIYRNGLIDLKELELFAYQFLVVYQNPGVKEYLRQVQNTLEASRQMNPRVKLIRPVAAYQDICEILEKKYGHVQAWRGW